MWAFESISFVALNTRMGLLTDQPDPNAAQLAKHMSDFFDYSFKYDLQPSIWPYYKTRGFKKFLQTYDHITEITTNYIEAAINRFEQQPGVENRCVLEQLLGLNKQVAVVMAMDMLMAGIDTVGFDLAINGFSDVRSLSLCRPLRPLSPYCIIYRAIPPSKQSCCGSCSAYCPPPRIR